jgi:hypothetical protein
MQGKDTRLAKGLLESPTGDRGRGRLTPDETCRFIAGIGFEAIMGGGLIGLPKLIDRWASGRPSDWLVS